MIKHQIGIPIILRRTNNLIKLVITGHVIMSQDLMGDFTIKTTVMLDRSMKAIIIDREIRSTISALAKVISSI